MTPAPDADGAADVDHCPCGVVGPQPWRPLRSFLGPVAFVCGVLTLVVAAVAANVGRVVWFAPVVAAALVVSALVAVWTQQRAGHRGWCRAGRIAWFTVCGPGIPLRLVTALAI